MDAHTVPSLRRDDERRIERRIHPDRHRLRSRIVPPDIDFADDLIHDSDEVLTINTLPTSLTILGGGVIGCEYACMFAALGVGVTLVDARSEILPFLDARDRRARLKAAMSQAPASCLIQGQRWGAVSAAFEQRRRYHARRRPQDREPSSCCSRRGAPGAAADLGLETVGCRAGLTRLPPESIAQFRAQVPQHLGRRRRDRLSSAWPRCRWSRAASPCHAFGFSYKTSRRRRRCLTASTPSRR